MNITNDLVTEYINKFYIPLSDKFLELRQKSEAEKVPIILKETEYFLTFLLKTLKPDRILEIGTAVGYSASVFAQVTDAQIVTIEKDPDVAEIAKANIKALGYEKNITVLTGDGEEALKQLDTRDLQPFDMVFIDAAKSHYKRFLEASVKLCGEGAVIVSDNVLFKARVASDQYDPNGKYKTNIRKMREYLEFINDDPRFDTTIIACGDGLALSKYKGNRE